MTDPQRRWRRRAWYSIAALTVLVAISLFLSGTRTQDEAGRPLWSADELLPAPEQTSNGWSMLVENNQILERLILPQQVSEVVDGTAIEAPDWGRVLEVRDAIQQYLATSDARSVLALFDVLTGRSRIVEEDCPPSSPCPAKGLWLLHKVISASILQAALADDWALALVRAKDLLRYDTESADGSRSSVRLLYALGGAQQTERVLALVLGGMQHGGCLPSNVSGSVVELQKMMSSETLGNSGARRSIIRRYLRTRNTLDSGCSTIAEAEAGHKCGSSLPLILYSKDETMADNDKYYASVMRFLEGRAEQPSPLNYRSQRWWWLRNVLGRRLVMALDDDPGSYVAAFLANQRKWTVFAAELRNRLAIVPRCPE